MAAYLEDAGFGGQMAAEITQPCEARAFEVARERLREDPRILLDRERRPHVRSCHY